MISQAPIELAVYTAGIQRRRTMADEVRRSLMRQPRELPCRYFYDDHGSALFDQITELPEYYLTRAETGILQKHGRQIALMAQPAAIVELGAGSCTKSRLLIAPAHELGSLRHFVPFDISLGPVQQAAKELLNDFLGLHVYGVVGEFETHLEEIPRLGRQLLLFLGSTIGNLDDAEQVGFLRRVRGIMAAEDSLLLGVDLVKDERTLNAAYDDSLGVTAEFNRNLLAVINRELGADFDLGRFQHTARYDPRRTRMEMYLRSISPQRVQIPGADLVVDLEEGEAIRTEISVKFTRESIERSMSEAGLETRAWFTDAQQRFATVLAVPASTQSGSPAR